MSQTTSTAASASTNCGACQQPNEANAQFCGSCGHALYEKCDSCGESVGLTQKFCKSCGRDLASWLEQRVEATEKRLAEAVLATKEHAFDKALTILARIGETKDFRFRKQAERAAQARAKVETLRDRLLNDANERMMRAADAADAGNQAQAVQLLARVPEKLLDDRSAQILKSGQRFLQQLEELQGELKTSLAHKNYPLAAALVGQLLELQPDNAKYAGLAKQLSDSLLKRVEKSMARQEYEAAARTLETIPESARSERFHALSDRLLLIQWLSREIQAEPSATNALGKLAVRFAKEVPGNGNAAELVNQLTAAVKSKRQTPRDLFPDWTGSSQSWLAPRMATLGKTQSINLSEIENPPVNLGNYAVAIGLALQGLGLSRVSGNLIVKKGLKAKFSGTKSKITWGIDVSTTGLRAVKMRIEKGAEQPIVEELRQVEFEAPLCRGKSVRGGAGADELSKAVSELNEQVDFEKSTVWSNLPSMDAIGRFCELPPVNDKEADRLIDLEVKHRIPIEKEDLALMVWRPDYQKKVKEGRPVMLAAATQATVNRRVDALAIAGLKVDGLVPEPIALANFMAFEFKDSFEPDKNEGTDDEVAAANDEAGEQVLALVDSGAAKTTIVIVSPRLIWFWTQESGGEDVTSIVARHTKMVAGDADRAKRTLASIERPDLVDQEIEQKQHALRMRLITAYNDAQKTFRGMQVQQVWCVGAASLQHGFLRRVLGK